MKRLLEIKEDGTQVWFESDGDGNWSLYTITDMTKNLELNKAMREDADFSKKGIRRGMWLYASVPCDVLAAWHHKGIINLNYPLSPPRTDGKLYKLRRQFLERTKQFEELRQMDLRAEWGERNKKAMTRMLNDPDYAYLKTTRGRI